jgi:hypothetical protein
MIHTDKPVLAWWSGGLTSAVACKLTLEKYSNVKIVYIHINSHHKDTLRFKTDCEQWYGQEIELVQSNYQDQFAVIAKKKFINSPYGAPCTTELKKKVREQIMKDAYHCQIWGFEFELSQINRAIRMSEQYEFVSEYPLIEHKLNKEQCAGIIQLAGIDQPKMYSQGYNNNNCIGCVKGGKGYWNKIRKDYPDTFKQMLELETEIGATCLKDVALKDLDPNIGIEPTEILPNCGLFCQLEMEHIISPKAIKIFNNETT